MRALRFLLRYAEQPLFILTYGVLYFLPGFRISIPLYSEDEIQRLISDGKSLIRFGDGEINILLGLRNHYQEFSPRLRSMLRALVREYRPDGPYVLAVPGAITQRNDTLKRAQRFNIWLPFKALFLLSFPRAVPYGDEHAFYYDGFAQRILVPALEGKTVILITNARTIEKQRANPRLAWKNMLTIETPENDLLDSCDELERSIHVALDLLPEGERAALLFAAGPAGKILMKRLSEAGEQCIDIGRGAETMFTDESIQSLI